MRENKNRNANMELLRVLSMIMVVCIHLFTKTSVLWEIPEQSPAYHMSWILYGLCMTGVNCFVLLTGYFMIYAEFKLEKLLNIYVQVLFYSLVMAFIVRCVLHLELSTGLRRAILPVTSGEYWFATVYLALYLLGPFVNILVRNLNKESFQRLLLILGILFSVIPTFLDADGWLGDGGAYGIVWFIFLYLLGSYIRKYQDVIPDKKYGCYYFASVAVIPISKIVKLPEVFYRFNSLPALLSSVFLFLFFARKKESYGKLDRLILLGGRLSFGVYLIHNNPNFSHFMWEKLNIHYFLTQKGNLVIVLLILLTLYFACSIIEWFRQCLFKWCKIDWMISQIAHPRRP